MTYPSVTQFGPATTDWNDFVGTAAADVIDSRLTSLFRRVPLRLVTRGLQDVPLVLSRRDGD